VPITTGATATLIPRAWKGGRPKDTNQPVRILTPQLSTIRALCARVVPGLDAGESRFFPKETWGKTDFSLAFSASSPANLVDRCILRHPTGGLNPKPKTLNPKP
jgi:hypothetical protein